MLNVLLVIGLCLFLVLGDEELELGDLTGVRNRFKVLLCRLNAHDHDEKVGLGGDQVEQLPRSHVHLRNVVNNDKEAADRLECL